MKVVVIDAGHGGTDPGAVGNGYKESHITLQVAKEIANNINKQSGIKAILTRDSDKTMALDQRTIFANRQKADLFISIHCNSNSGNPATGTETFKCVNEAVTNKLAIHCNKAVVSTLGLKDRGVKSSGFYVLKYTNMPAVLVELGFINNPTDAKHMADKSKQFKLGVELAKVICESAGVKYNSQSGSGVIEDAYERCKAKGIFGSYVKRTDAVTYEELANILVKVLR